MRLIVADAASGPVPALQAVDPMQIWKAATGEVAATGYVAAGFQWIRWPAVGVFRLDPNGEVVTMYPEPRADVRVIEDIWRRSVLPLALLGHGFEALHASAVSASGGVVAFAAPSKTGKSTLAHALRARGCRQWADDAVVFRVDRSTQTAAAFSFPFSMRLKGRDRARFEPSSTEVADVPSAPLCAICILSRLPEDAPAPLTIHRLHGTAALLSLLPNAHVFDPGDRDRERQMIEALLTVVDSVPVYDLQFRPGAEAWDEVLDGVSALIAAH